LFIVVSIGKEPRSLRSLRCLGLRRADNVFTKL